jgi:protein gp37
MGKTGIAWTDYSWNPTTGCNKVSEECDNCYAETVSRQKEFTDLPWTATNASVNVVEHPERLSNPTGFNMGGKLSEQKHPRYPIKIFVDSMSDLFHDQVSDAFIEQVFGVMTDPKHRHRIFQILTKRPGRAVKWPGPWTPNIWMGVTCGHYKSKPRIDILRGCAAHVKFISAEPLLTSLKPLDLTGIDWIIAGGESGTGFRPMEMSWARESRDEAVSQGTAFFYKQDAAGSNGQRKYLVEEDGSCWKWLQYPDYLIPPVQVAPQNLKYHKKRFPLCVPSITA